MHSLLNSRASEHGRGRLITVNDNDISRAMSCQASSEIRKHVFPPAAVHREANDRLDD